MTLKQLLLGSTAYRCAQCGARVPDGEGFRVASFQVFCNEREAVAYQENNPL